MVYSVIRLTLPFYSPKRHYQSEVILMSYESPYFHQISMNFFHAFWIYHINKIRMDRWTDGWVDTQMDNPLSDRRNKKNLSMSSDKNTNDIL